MRPATRETAGMRTERHTGNRARRAASTRAMRRRHAPAAAPPTRDSKAYRTRRWRPESRAATARSSSVHLDARQRAVIGDNPSDHSHRDVHGDIDAAVAARAFARRRHERQRNRQAGQTQPRPLEAVMQRVVHRLDSEPNVNGAESFHDRDAVRPLRADQRGASERTTPFFAVGLRVDDENDVDRVRRRGQASEPRDRAPERIGAAADAEYAGRALPTRRGIVKGPDVRVKSAPRIAEQRRVQLGNITPDRTLSGAPCYLRPAGAFSR